MAKRPRRAEDGEAAVMLLILVFLIAGIVFWLFYSRAQAEAAARSFAQSAGVQLAQRHDRKFLDVHIGLEVATRYPPSFRDRMVAHLIRLGVANDNPEVEGEVTFTSQFFHPQGHFRVHLFYPGGIKADLFLAVSNSHSRWQIDDLNLVWYPPPPPAAPTPEALAPGPPPGG